MFPDHIRELAAKLLAEYELAGYTLATAESCTGGLIAGALTDIAGSSKVVDRGFVTYSNVAKSEMLGVPPSLIYAHGAVSPEVAVAMAVGALAKSKADVTVAVTGVAGPGGGTPEKPVGRVYIATAVRRGTAKHKEYTFPGDREAVRLATVQTALERLRTARPETGIR
ncbi:CinA family protein [Azospirillum brasilense]|uniref:CinA family protein n=1 Tax=Azospirillum brasilense TaxID=192 RepID=A0A0P0EE01_AZOBR|nr:MULTISPECIES: CinA family protein [Azospirillum]ALJ37298.1 damage-inducible protein CinA [Azospirillum brasilense]MDW7552023.1 CinA family protein [Azospirillum brasilense]MDW7591458.1 CinA family protein [Azospirillum brasilense]MDW7626628.1 CinA family protein [Azospirillum brasilense]MDX5951023.1 CinA family protein [Azospirillum brasilense]